MAADAWPFGRWRRLAALLPSGWLKLCGLGLLLSFCWRWRRLWLLRWRLSRTAQQPPALVAQHAQPAQPDPEMVTLESGDINPAAVPPAMASRPPLEPPPSPPSLPAAPAPAPAPPAPAPPASDVAAAVKAAPRPRADSGLARGFFNKPAKKAKKTPPAAEAPKPSTATPEARQAAKDAVLREQEAGVRFFHSCAFREAKTTFDRMRRLASEAQLGKEEGQAYRLLANCLDKLNAPEEEIDAAYKQAMKLAHQHDDMQLSFNVLTGMGSHEVKKEHLDEAEHLYFQSLMLAKRVLSPHEEAIAEGNLGMCLGQMEGRRAESLEHFRKALKLQDGSNTHSTVTLLANYASALCADDRYEEAQKEYEEALSLARKIGDRRVEVNILTNLANLCEHVLSLPAKASLYRRALKGHGLADDGDGVGMAMDLCAICLENLEDGRPQIVLGCNHIYHSECFEGVLSSESESRSKCPQCRNSHSRFAAA